MTEFAALSSHSEPRDWQDKEFNAIKREQFPWIMESPRDANDWGWVDYACDGCGVSGRIDGYPREGTPDDSVAAAEVEHFLATGCKGSLRVVRSLPPMPEPPPVRFVRE